MGNVLVQNNDEIDLETLTRAVAQSLPELIAALDTYLCRYRPG